MKATNVYQSLKSKGVCGTDGMKPQLPGIGSPLKKSPYKFNAGLKEAAAEGKLDENPKFKAAVESSPAKKKVDGKPKKEVKAQSITYDPASGTTTRTFSDADVKKYNVKKQIVTKAKPKSPAKKASCGSPVKMDLGVAGPGNPKKAIRKAKKKATKGHKAGVRASNICKRSTRGKGSTYRN